MNTGPETPEVQAPPRPSGSTGPIVHLFPSLTDLVFLLPFFLTLKHEKGLSRLLLDSDTGWHLRTGEWIMQHGRVPVVDMFSFTRAGQPWFAWEWLWDLMFGWLHLHTGLAGVALVSLAVVALSLVVVFRTALRRSGNVFIVVALTIADFE